MSCIVCGVPLQGQQVKYCSNARKQKTHYHRARANPNSYHSQTVRALRRKLRFVDALGGACATCGYDRNLAALHFHHREGPSKDFALDARNLSNRRLFSLERELAKCELLCANCYAERHHPESQRDAVEAWLRKASAQGGPAGI